MPSARKGKRASLSSGASTGSYKGYKGYIRVISLHKGYIRFYKGYIIKGYSI